MATKKKPTSKINTFFIVFDQTSDTKFGVPLIAVHTDIECAIEDFRDSGCNESDAHILEITYKVKKSEILKKVYNTQKIEIK